MSKSRMTGTGARARASKLFTRLLVASVIAGLPLDIVRAEIPRGAGIASLPLGSCPTDLRYLNHVTGWQLQWTQALGAIAGAPTEARSAALAEWREAGKLLRADLQILQSADTVPAPLAVVDRVISQVRQLDHDLGNGTLMRDAKWRLLLQSELRPALRDYADYLDSDYRARAARTAGLPPTAVGRACFLGAARWWTTLEQTPEEIEAAGHRLLDEARRELLKEAGASSNELQEVLARLREPQPGLTRQELLQISQRAVARANAAVPRAFEVESLPPVTIEPIQRELEASLPAAFYRAGSPAAAAAYVVNLSRPSERRLMAEVIAFHETVPGHHLAASTPQATGGSFNSAFVEGWAIYAEYLAAELGLYSSAHDRLGIRAKHLWAASRLIVEPGLHIRGWTREQAVRFMRENTALSDAEIDVEIDRYLALPGQSLAYMLGADRIRRARVEAETAIGGRFDIKAFHRIVLSGGVRPIEAVEADVRRWVKEVG